MTRHQGHALSRVRKSLAEIAPVDSSTVALARRIRNETLGASPASDPTSCPDHGQGSAPTEIDRSAAPDGAPHRQPPRGRPPSTESCTTNRKTEHPSAVREPGGIEVPDPGAQRGLLIRPRPSRTARHCAGALSAARPEPPSPSLCLHAPAPACVRCESRRNIHA